MSMLPPNVYYSAILMAAGVACLVVAVIIWFLRREAVGARTLAVFLLGLAWWDITYSIFWIDFPGPSPYFWLDITLMGGFIVPTAFLIFSLEFSNMQRWLQRPILLALWIEPVITFIILCTDPWHNLYFGGKRALNTTMILNAGPVSWANIYYSYVLILIGIVVLGIKFHRSSGVYRMQTAMILAGIIIPWVVHISYMSTGGLLPNADMTPFIFSVTALFIAFALVRYRLLDITPIAHSVLIESMSEGVLVLDDQNRVLDINPAARNVVSSKMVIGEPVEKVFMKWSEFVGRYFNEDKASAEFSVQDRFLDLRISPLHNKRGRFVGRLVVWRDITELKNTQLMLEQLATIDELTLAYNRRHFMKLAEAQVNKARRHGSPLTLAVIDLDYFKDINDQYGHPVGDKVLKEVSSMLRECIRDFDLFGRLGGEEFALLMPDTDAEKAYQVSERLRVAMMENPINIDGQALTVTFSLGLTELKGENDLLSSMLRRADHALYAAKKAGRNQVIVWDESTEEKAGLLRRTKDDE